MDKIQNQTSTSKSQPPLTAKDNRLPTAKDEWSLTAEDCAPHFERCGALDAWKIHNGGIVGQATSRGILIIKASKAH
jgi:hypothetical protein